MRCFKCCQFGHTSKLCNYKEICLLCSYSHDKNTPCKNNKQIKCINCIYYNKKNGTNIRIDHAASNINHCSIYKQYKKSSTKKIDYNKHPSLN